MNLKTISTLAAMSLLLPALALAQSVGVNANVHVNAATSIGGSATISATAMTTAKSRADKEIDRRITALNALNTRVQAMTRVTSSFKAQLSTNIQSQISSLTTLKSKIDADTDSAALKTDIKSITTSYRIYALIMPQSHIAAAADRAVNIATMESALGAKLKVRVDAAAAAGSDTTALNALLADLASSTTAAVVQAQAAVTLTAALQPDNGDKTLQQSNLKALQDAHKDLQAAQQDLVQGRKDITNIVQDLRALGASGSASTTLQAH